MLSLLGLLLVALSCVRRLLSGASSLLDNDGDFYYVRLAPPRFRAYLMAAGDSSQLARASLPVGPLDVATLVIYSACTAVVCARAACMSGMLRIYGCPNCLLCCGSSLPHRRRSRPTPMILSAAACTERPWRKGAKQRKPRRCVRTAAGMHTGESFGPFLPTFCSCLIPQPRQQEDWECALLLISSPFNSC